jgi:hypothetical protein
VVKHGAADNSAADDDRLGMGLHGSQIVAAPGHQSLYKPDIAMRYSDIRVNEKSAHNSDLL